MSAGNMSVASTPAYDGSPRMIRRTLDRFLVSSFIVPLSTAISLLLGLVFTFVWAPHPWGWYGIDFYHQLATDLAQGRAFSTLDVPWGYAYLLALFYRLFGPTAVPPLLAQAALNAAIPALIYKYARDAFEPRVAAIAALLTGLLSFNTVYASTESSDSVCTVVFVAMVVLFAIALRRDGWLRFGICGALCGLAAQFRPNLILVPVLLASFALVYGLRSSHRVRNALIVVMTAAAMLVPWTIRNFRLTGQFIPTSTHGGQQFWYGTLQTGPYLDSRAYNPRSVFETSVFDYSSLLNVPILVEGTLTCAPGTSQSVDLMYWTNASATPQRVPLDHVAGSRYAGAIPAQFQPRTVYYYFEVRRPPTGGERPPKWTPEGGALDPFVYFLSEDHLGDVDSGDALLDVFDLARLLRHIAWGEPVRAADKLDRDANGRLDEADFRAAVSAMLSRLTEGRPVEHVHDVAVTPGNVRARFMDGSELIVPHAWNGLVTDLQVGEGVASALLPTLYRFTQPKTPRRTPLEDACLGLTDIGMNRPFYRVQPHEMRRYTALAIDNIRRSPGAYAFSVLYRAVRLFVIRGSEDRHTAVQFAGSRVVYLAASAASASYLAFFLAGVVVAWRSGYAIWLPLALIAYIPATIAFGLTNMRYTVTVQPLIFVFVAVTLAAILKRIGLISPVSPW